MRKSIVVNQKGHPTDYTPIEKHPASYTTTLKLSGTAQSWSVGCEGPVLMNTIAVLRETMLSVSV